MGIKQQKELPNKAVRCWLGRTGRSFGMLGEPNQDRDINQGLEQTVFCSGLRSICLVDPNTVAGFHGNSVSDITLVAMVPGSGGPEQAVHSQG